MDYLDDIQREGAALQAQSRKSRSVSWQWFAHLVAYALLLASFGLFLRAYWYDTGPAWLPSPDGALAFLSDALVAIVFAAASAIIPPILISALLPNSPGNMVLARLNYRYGWPGQLFAFLLCAVLLYRSYEVLTVYWSTRPGFVLPDGTPDVVDVRSRVMLTMGLFYGFTAWALQYMTTAQWVDAMLGGLQAQRLHMMLDLLKMTEQAIKARSKALLYADVAQMTVEQQRVHGQEVAALLAGIQRGFVREMKYVLGEADSRTNMALLILPKDDQIITRHKLLADTIAAAADDMEQRTTYLEVYSAPDEAATPPAAETDEAAPRAASEGVRERPFPQQERETNASANDGARPPRDPEGPPRTTANDRVRDTRYLDELRAAVKTFGPSHFKRANLQTILSCEKTKASQIIASWKVDRLIAESPGNADHYHFTAEGAARGAS